MNLIHDAWIPVRRQSGSVERIAPWQITDRHDGDLIVRVASPRPDFDGALVQFLIGLLQTCLAPDNDCTWRQNLASPPSPEELMAGLSTVAAAFNLDGSGPRFMQDLTLEQEIEPKKRADATNAIAQLLLETPGDQAMKLNKDLFVKRGGCERLCPFCAAAALFTLQTNAPAGGRGHLAGIRGPRLITTIIASETLWSLVWSNVLRRDEFLASTGDRTKTLIADRFPWMGKSRTREPGGVQTTPLDAHPDQVFWAMPRRIRLHFEESSSLTSCDLCGSDGTIWTSSYLTKSYGVKYSGPWKHPLSPYYDAADGSPKTIYPQPGGIGYRHWLGIVSSAADGRSRKQPAAVIERYWISKEKDARLWAFGYEMDNMKARSWQESVMPLVLCRPEHRQDFENRIACLVKGADTVAYATRIQVKAALFKQGATVRGDLSFVSERFWGDTEAAFYEHLARIRDAIDGEQDPVAVIESWHRVIAGAADRIFNDLSQAGAFEACDPKRIAKAWNELQQMLYGRKIREVLGLPTITAPKTGKRGGKSARGKSKE